MVEHPNKSPPTSGHRADETPCTHSIREKDIIVSEKNWSAASERYAERRDDSDDDTYATDLDTMIQIEKEVCRSINCDVKQVGQMGLRSEVNVYR